MNNYKKFVNLHHRDEPLVLGNVWDVSSAKQLVLSGYEALGTSSAAIVDTLSYQDGEGMPFEELLFVVKRILKSIHVPLSVDIEGGYSRDPIQIIGNIKALHQLGVAGINIEDSIFTDKREIVPLQDFKQLLTTVSAQLNKEKIDVFLNVRTDTYLLDLPDALPETVKRIKAYQECGAHGIFVPCITAPDDIKEVATSIDLPLNVMCMPQLPDFDKLATLGVKRISMGNFVHSSLLKWIESQGKQILSEKSFQLLF